MASDECVGSWIGCWTSYRPATDSLGCVDLSTTIDGVANTVLGSVEKCDTA